MIIRTYNTETCKSIGNKFTYVVIFPNIKTFFKLSAMGLSLFNLLQ